MICICVCVHVSKQPVCYGLAGIQRVCRRSLGGGWEDASSRGENHVEEGKVTHQGMRPVWLEQVERGQMWIRQLRGRKGPRRWDLGALGNQRCHPRLLCHIQPAGPGAEVQGKVRTLWRTRQVHTDVAGAQEALVMIDGDAREKAVRNTKELLDFVA